MQRPRVVIHIAQTVDARISFRREPGKKKWEDVIASKAPKATPLWGRVLREKIRPNALLSGSETLIISAGKRKQEFSTKTTDHPEDSKDYLPADVARSVRQRKRSGWQIAVDSGGRISWGLREKTFWGKNWHPLVLVSKKTPGIYLSQLRRKHIPFLVAGTRRVDLCLAMKKIYDELGVRCVASLGGGRLNGALLQAGLVDEVSVVLIPMIVGGKGIELGSCQSVANSSAPGAISGAVLSAMNRVLSVQRHCRPGP
jgi:2,5-diamino-6-(ribosylamino)-4(3H)-pyrimidinone 5'-phosphate reductase